MSDRYRKYFEDKQKRQRIGSLLAEGSKASRQLAYQLASELQLTVEEMQTLENNQLK